MIMLVRTLLSSLKTGTNVLSSCEQFVLTCLQLVSAAKCASELVDNIEFKQVEQHEVLLTNVGSTIHILQDGGRTQSNAGTHEILEMCSIAERFGI